MKLLNHIILNIFQTIAMIVFSAIIGMKLNLNRVSDFTSIIYMGYINNKYIQKREIGVWRFNVF